LLTKLPVSPITYHCSQDKPISITFYRTLKNHLLPLPESIWLIESHQACLTKQVNIPHRFKHRI